MNYKSYFPSLAYIRRPRTVSKRKLNTFLKSTCSHMTLSSARIKSNILKNMCTLHADTFKQTSGVLIASSVKLPFISVSKKQCFLSASEQDL